MKRQNVGSIFKNVCSILGVFVLICLVYKTSSFIVSSSVIDSFKINKKTSEYLSFNYADTASSIYEIENVRKVSDFVGKRLLNEYFDFEVSIPKDSLTTESVEYEVIVKGINTVIDDENIKIYLSDQNNKSLKGFQNTVPLFTMFDDNGNGKVIYTGSFNKNNLSDKYRLRIWVNSSYYKNIDEKMSFSIEVKIK